MVRRWIRQLHSAADKLLESTSEELSLNGASAVLLNRAQLAAALRANGETLRKCLATD